MGKTIGHKNKSWIEKEFELQAQVKRSEPIKTSITPDWILITSSWGTNENSN